MKFHWRPELGLQSTVRDEAVKLAGLIRTAKLSTIVAAGSRCASACFIVFAAGNEKFASYEAAIGVHGVSDKFGHETAQTVEATIAMARIASGFGRAAAHRRTDAGDARPRDRVADARRSARHGRHHDRSARTPHPAAANIP